MNKEKTTLNLKKRRYFTKVTTLFIVFFTFAFIFLEVCKKDTLNAIYGNLPNTYDPRNVNDFGTDLIKQERNGDCWACAAGNGWRIFLRKTGLVGPAVDTGRLLFSFKQKKHEYEPGLPYSPSNGNKTLYCDCFTSWFGSPSFLVKGIEFVDDCEEAIKKAVAEQGSVQACYGVKKDCYHTITIIGWDDNKKEWLIADSDGSVPGIYRNLPYSTTFYDCTSFTQISKNNNQEKLYVHDQYGDSFKYVNGTYTNVFTSNRDEKLTDIMINSSSAGAKFKAFLAPIGGDGLPSCDSNTWIFLTESTVPYKGYSTHMLTNKVPLEKGKKFAVVIQGDSKFSIALPKATPCAGLSYVFNNKMNRFEDISTKTELGPSKAVTIRAITQPK